MLPDGTNHAPARVRKISAIASKKISRNPSNRRRPDQLTNFIQKNHFQGTSVIFEAISGQSTGDALGKPARYA